MQITGENLKEFRKSLELGQSDFSKLLGYTCVEHVCRMERGKLSVPMHTQVLVHILRESPKARKIAANIAGITLRPSSR